MILPSSRTQDWIFACAKKYKSDPTLIEKVIRALTLLECLKRAKLPFIFKGGTALMLMIQEPRRFSIDIDIILEKGDISLAQLFDQVLPDSGFISWKEHLRAKKQGIEKRHFKFFYHPLSTSREKEDNVLLDIVYESNPYTLTHLLPVSHFLLQQTSTPIQVVAPTLPALMGDKLTAFGPNTTGIPLSRPKEVMKQVYDIAGIFDRIPDFHGVYDNFISVARRELAYRELGKAKEEIIVQDILSTAQNFCTHGRKRPEEFRLIRSGIQQMRSFIYGDKFREPEAQKAMAKAAYSANRILRGDKEIIRFQPDKDLSDWVLRSPEISALNKLKKYNLEAFHYWFLAFQPSALDRNITLRHARTPIRTKAG